MKQPSEFAQKKRQEDTGELRILDWYNEDGDVVARRRQVWSLIGWYHRAVLAPQLGFSGALRRLWWKLAGWLHPKKERRMHYRKKLLSPWDLLEIRAYLQAQAEAEAEREELERRHANGGGSAQEEWGVKRTPRQE